MLVIRLYNGKCYAHQKKKKTFALPRARAREGDNVDSAMSSCEQNGIIVTRDMHKYIF